MAGGGLGGISAALAAAERGSSVVLIEAADRLGGTSLYSGGAIYIRGVKTFEEYKKICPLVDPVLGRILVTGFEEYVQWLLKMKAPGSYTEKKTGFRGSKTWMWPLSFIVTLLSSMFWVRLMVGSYSSMGLLTR